MLRADEKSYECKKREETLREWLAIQQKSIQAVKHTLTFCLQQSQMDINELPVNALERNIVAVCYKIHLIGEYQRCIDAYFDSCPMQDTKELKKQHKVCKTEIQEIKEKLYDLVVQIQEKVKDLKIKTHYTALFRTQISDMK